MTEGQSDFLKHQKLTSLNERNSLTELAVICAIAESKRSWLGSQSHPILLEPVMKGVKLSDYEELC